MAVSADDAARQRILDAGFDCAARFGLRRTTMAEVAKAAGVARQTVYRYFATRHALFAALVLREDERLAETVRAAAEAHADLRPALEAAFLAALRALREHPLLDRVMATEPHELLPYLTVEANPLLEMGMRVTEGVLSERLPEASPLLIHRAAEMCARVFLTYAIVPPADDPEEVAANLAELICHGLAKSYGRTS
jgi:AcrR family transcriptional regulator